MGYVRQRLNLRGVDTFSVNLITEEILRAVMPAARAQDVADFCAAINAAMREFEITTPERQAAFLAQIAEESDQLWHGRDHYGTKRGEEYASGAAYEGRKDLGNVHPGDGVKFKGHGLLQTTGAINHEKVHQAIGIDCVNRPELLCEPEGASRAAGHYWKLHGCNELADAGKFETITHVINGGLNGLERREQFWGVARASLAI